jgi:hypothetical protein
LKNLMAKDIRGKHVAQSKAVSGQCILRQLGDLMLGVMAKRPQLFAAVVQHLGNLPEKRPLYHPIPDSHGAMQNRHEGLVSWSGHGPSRRAHAPLREGRLDLPPFTQTNHYLPENEVQYRVANKRFRSISLAGPWPLWSSSIGAAVKLMGLRQAYQGSGYNWQ